MAKSSGNATVTAPIGPGDASVATVITGFRKCIFDVDKEKLSIQEADGRRIEWELNTIATVTYVIANNVATVTIST